MWDVLRNCVPFSACMTPCDPVTRPVTSVTPRQAIESYEKLGVKHEPLKLITPQFETPLPPLQPAVS